MTLEQRAEALADYANECCGRSDGYWDDVKTQALEHLRAVVEACAEVTELEACSSTDCVNGTCAKLRKAAQRIRQEVGQ